eukprot:1037970-Rhodomonas_salina.1
MDDGSATIVGHRFPAQDSTPSPVSECTGSSVRSSKVWSLQERCEKETECMKWSCAQNLRRAASFAQTHTLRESASQFLQSTTEGRGCRTPACFRCQSSAGRSTQSGWPCSCRPARA